MFTQPQSHSTQSWLPSNAPRKLLSEITEPGTYVCHGSGDLLRVAEAENPPGDAAPMDSQDGQPVYVTRVSSNPFFPISRARVAAANMDIEIQF